MISWDNTYVDEFIYILGLYGIILAFSTQMGIKHGSSHDKIIHSPLQIIILYASVFIVSNKHILSLYAIILYYFVKYMCSLFDMYNKVSSTTDTGDSYATL